MHSEINLSEILDHLDCLEWVLKLQEHGVYADYLTAHARMHVSGLRELFSSPPPNSPTN